MNLKTIIAAYWASPAGFVGLVYIIGNNWFNMNIDLGLYIKASLCAIIPIALPISLYEVYKHRKHG